MKNLNESKFKEVYERIAEECHTTVDHVYVLAHGSHAQDHKDSQIIDKLAENGIVSVRKKKRSKKHHRRFSMLFIITAILVAILFVIMLYFTRLAGKDVPQISEPVIPEGANIGTTK